MATIGEQLKETERLRTRERVAHQSDILRKFVKEDLLKSLKDNIEKGGHGLSDARLLAPEAIRPLFQGRLCYEDTLSIDNPNSVFAPVWNELKEWMDAENLKLAVGEDMGRHNRGGVPWSDKEWGGYLYISIPTPGPTKPTPPQPVKTTQGIVLSPGEVTVIVVLLTVLLALFTLYIVRT